MKKTVKLLSFVLLVSMLFSMMAVSASAIVSDTPAGNGGGIVLGGGGNASVNSGGSLIIGGDQRPEDDSPFTGTRVEELPDYNSQIEKARATNSSTDVATYAQEAAAKYMKKADGDYSGIIDSEYTLVQENEDFLMYVRDNLESIDDATLQTAVDLFGDEAVYGTSAGEIDEQAVEERKEEISSEQSTLSSQIDTLAAQLDEFEAGYEDDSYQDNADYQALLAQYDALVSQFNNLQAENDGIDQFMNESATLMSAVTIPDRLSSRFSEVAPGYSSLAEAVASVPYNNVIRFSTGNSFDICNSTGYRITVDLHAATIDARACQAAFTIRSGKYGGTTTFTNGTIVGDGFYVTSGGVLNLGGLVNGNYVDITVYAQRNAVYIDEWADPYGTTYGNGTVVIGQGTTLVGGIPGVENPTATTYKNDATKYYSYSAEPVVKCVGGTVRMTGGTIIAGSVDGTAAAPTNYAIEMDGGTLEISSSVAEVTSRNPNAPAIYAHNSATVNVHNGYIYGPTGIAITGTNSTLKVNGGAITGYGSPVANDGTLKPFPNTGAAIAVEGDAKESGDSPLVYINGGTLRSERSAGIVTDPRPLSDADRALITRIAVDDVNVTIQQVKGEVSDYAKSLFIVSVAEAGVVTNYGYSTPATLMGFLTGGTISSDATVTIELLSDFATSAPFSLDSTAGSVVFNGNSHVVRVTDTDGVNITTGNVTIKNVSFDGNHNGYDGINVSGGSTVYIGPNVTVGHFDNGLHVLDDGTTVTVNGFTVEAHNPVGICVDDNSKTTILMCKVDSRTPIDARNLGTDGILYIDGGWFAYKEDVANPPVSGDKVATYVDPDVAYVKYVEKDKYYEVLYNDTPNVEIDTTITTRYGNEPQPDGSVIPYIIYDKSNPDPIVFKEVMPSLIQIDAVGIMTLDGKVVPNGEVYPIFSAPNGRTGTIRIPDRAVLEDLPSGRYDLRFTFKRGSTTTYPAEEGYVMENKLRLYVFPKYAGLFAVPNNEEISPSVMDPMTLTEFFNGNIVEYLNSNFDLIKTNTAYPIGAIGWNVAIVTSELPDKVTIGNAADNTNSILLENYIFDPSTATGYTTIQDDMYHNAEDRTTWGVVPSGPYKDYYFYIISYADLNNLSAGQNWVFLNWNGMDGALKNLPLTIKNDYVSISPTTVKWSKINGDVTFTIRPTCDAVYIDGELVPSGYWTYDPSTHVMTLKGTYLGAMDAKDHMLEVVTGLGKASATITTGMGLMANGIDYHVYGQNRVVSFAASDRINQDGGVWIGSSNPTRLDPSAYTWNGTNGFTLNSAFLNRLALGTYYISAYVYNGSNGYNYTTTTFRVISATQASNNPATGDDSNITLWLVILALSAVAIVVIAVPQFKKKKGMH